MAFKDLGAAEVSAIKRVLNEVFPSVETGTLRYPVPADRHTSGVAMDVMLDIREPEEKALADALIGVLVAHGKKIHIACRKIVSPAVLEISAILVAPFAGSNP